MAKNVEAASNPESSLDAESSIAAQCSDAKEEATVTLGTPMGEKFTGSDEWQYGYCMGCMQADCSTKVFLKDGIVTHIEGNPESPLTRGKLCLRGIAATASLYNPYRVKAPMRRTNPKKGVNEDPGWVEISWDEALDTIGKRLKKIREEDPRKLAVWEGWGAAEVMLITSKEWERSANYVEGGLIFTKAFGTPNELFSHGPLCSIHYAANLVQAQHPEYISDLQHCKYLIAPGRTVGPNVGTPHASRRFIDAIDRGMKLVTIDPRFSAEASKAHRWVPVRPGTELAFTLAMLNVMFYEIGKLDEWSIKNRTNGVYLIRPDGDYARDKKTNKPLIWDPVDNIAKPFNDESIKDYAMWGEFEVDGEKVHPSLQLIKDQMKDYTPEWQEEITSIPAQTVRDISNEFVEHAQIGSTITIDGFEFPLRPAQFAGSGRGAMSQKGGTYFDLAGKIINMLVGAMEVPGGATGNRNPRAGYHVHKPNEDGLVTPIMEAIAVPYVFPPDHVGLNEYYPPSHATPGMVARAILDPKKYHLEYELDTMILCGSNPIRSFCDVDMFEEAFKKVPFVVSIAINFDESAMMSDIILPEHHFMERRYARFYLVVHQNIDDSARGLVMSLGRNPVKPLYNTMRMDDMFIEIADRAGFLKGEGGLNDRINFGFSIDDKYKLDINKKYSIDEMIDRRIKTIFGEQYSFEDALRHGIIYKYVDTGKKGYNYYYYPENKTRFPIYFDVLKKSGNKMRENLEKSGITLPGWEDQEDYFRYFEPIPYWLPNPELTAPPEWDMWAVNWKTQFMPFGTGDTQQNAWIADLREVDPYELYVLINTETAKKKDIADGEKIYVESRYGKVEGTAKLTELIHPEVAGIPACYGSGTIMMSPDSRKGSHFNRLMTAKEDVGIDPVSGSIAVSPKVKVYKVSKAG